MNVLIANNSNIMFSSENIVNELKSNNINIDLDDAKLISVNSDRSGT